MMEKNKLYYNSALNCHPTAKRKTVFDISNNRPVMSRILPVWRGINRCTVRIYGRDTAEVQNMPHNDDTFYSFEPKRLKCAMHGLPFIHPLKEMVRIHRKYVTH